MVQQCDVTEVEIDGRAFMVRSVGPWVLESGNVVAKALAVSLDKPLAWAIGLLITVVYLRSAVYVIRQATTALRLPDYREAPEKASQPVALLLDSHQASME